VPDHAGKILKFLLRQGKRNPLKRYGRIINLIAKKFLSFIIEKERKFIK
jgi:hypothetical protein